MEQKFPMVVLFIVLYKVVLAFQAVDEIFMCDHLNEIFELELICGPLFITIL